MDPTTPREIYEQKLAALRSQQSAEQRRERLFGYAKLLLAATAVCASPFLVRTASGIVVLCVLALAFAVFFLVQEKLLERIRLRTRCAAFYERGIARIGAAWQAGGERGERFLGPTHPYARDLDIFGDASVFQYLCNARTRVGEETLASWLLQPAAPEKVLERQTAVRELALSLELREKIYTAGEEVRSSVEPHMLIRWAEADPTLSTRGTRIATTILSLLWAGGVAAWAVTGEPLPALLLTVLNFAYAHRLHARADAVAEAVERAAAELRVFASLLSLIESTTFQSKRLQELGETLRASGIPSHSVRRLARLAELIQSRHSLFLRPLDLVLFWSVQLLFVAERWRRTHGQNIRAWIAIVGELEALASLAAFAFEHPRYAYPTFVADGPVFEAEQVAHPLLDEHAVGNDVRFDRQHALIVLSGPNMAGKSTFIRSLGVNAVLAQCGAPVRASRMVLSPLQVAASICVLDSLSGGVSRFYAEIRRLKLIDELTARSLPVLFLLDELLSGTNSHDRLAGTEFVLRTFVERGAIGIVSTHDLALTKIPDKLPDRAANLHFEDRLENGRLMFDYRLKPGVVRTSNALALMRAVGFGVPQDSDLPPVE